MRLGDYRSEYAGYCAVRAHALYDLHAGRTSESRLTPLQERYADLWTRASLDDLERARADSSAQFETERAALRNLINIARLGYVAWQAREVAAELLRCAAAARIRWDGTHVAATDVPDLLAHEPDAVRRRELAARQRDANTACDDLRAAHLAALRAASATLGFTSYSALRNEAAQADDTKLTAAADTLLARTGETYDAHLRAWAAQHLPPQLARTPVYADSLFFARLAQFDQFFPAPALPTTYVTAMAGLGIRVERQTNLRVEWEARAVDAASFACDAPADVRLVAGTRGGAHALRSLMYAAGCAQQLAWVSREMATRYPEFVHGPDETTRAAYGFLFRYLLHDPAWLAELRGLRTSEAQAIARGFALVELHDARRCCAQLHQQMALAAAPDVRAESLAAEYAARHTEATGFIYEPAQHLADSHERLNDAVTELRARLCAAALGEHLRTRHGWRWWATRGAGDELIDLWNTGARYPVEELTALIGAGALDVELWADALLTAVRES